MLYLVLYYSAFQSILLKMENQNKTELDSVIKDYIGRIRKMRDYMYKNQMLPINAIIETIL